jgi:hypothetical protein
MVSTCSKVCLQLYAEYDITLLCSVSLHYPDAGASGILSPEHLRTSGPQYLWNVMHVATIRVSAKGMLLLEPNTIYYG